MQTLEGTTWRLIGASAFDDDGHELPPPLGEHPMGFVMFEAERIMVAVVDGGLSLPVNVPSRVFAAYSGKFRFDGAELVTNVDSASNPNLAGQQIRHIHFESPARMVVTPKNKVLGRCGPEARMGEDRLVYLYFSTLACCACTASSQAAAPTSVMKSHRLMGWLSPKSQPTYCSVAVLCASQHFSGTDVAVGSTSTDYTHRPMSAPPPIKTAFASCRTGCPLPKQPPTANRHAIHAQVRVGH